MHKRSDFHNYQEYALKFIEQTPKCGLFIDMGLGKTTVSLTKVLEFLDDFFITNVLIIAPLRVANTVWEQETQDWDHLIKQMNIKICTGNAKQRLEALNSPADIHIINVENTAWLVENVKWKWDMLILDESSGYKSFKSKRFRALKKVTKYLSSILLLTGTPSPNSYMDLWSQIFLIDSGQRLGRNITIFRQRYFTQSGFQGYDYKLKPGAKEEIDSLIKDICISMDSDDYLELPPRISLYEKITLPPKVMKQYKEFEKEFILALSNDNEKELDALLGDDVIEAPSKATLSNKLLQICNGAIYDKDRNVHLLHDEKIKRLKEIIEDNPNENFLIAYNYKHDLDRLKKAFPKLVTLSSSGEEVDLWNKGKIRLLCVHPANAGHGLNLQYGGNILIYFGLIWSLELYQQLNKRLHRQGQTKPVKIIHLIAEGCMDENVLKALESKAKNQNELLEYLKAIIGA